MNKLRMIYEALGAMKEYQKENMSMLNIEAGSFFDRQKLQRAFRTTTKQEFPHFEPRPDEDIMVWRGEKIKIKQTSNS
jgi:hypothetical protein